MGRSKVFDRSEQGEHCAHQLPVSREQCRWDRPGFPAGPELSCPRPASAMLMTAGQKGRHGGRAGGGVLFSLSRATRSLLLYRLRSEHSLSCFSTKHSEQTLDEATRLRLPVPGLPSSADDRAVLPGDQGDLCRDNIQSSGQRMTDTNGRICRASWQRLVWGGSLVTLLGAPQEDSSRALTTCSRMSGQ